MIQASSCFGGEATATEAGDLRLGPRSSFRRSSSSMPAGSAPGPQPHGFVRARLGRGSSSEAMARCFSSVVHSHVGGSGVATQPSRPGHRHKNSWPHQVAASGCRMPGLREHDETGGRLAPRGQHLLWRPMKSARSSRLGWHSDGRFTSALWCVTSAAARPPR